MVGDASGPGSGLLMVGFTGTSVPDELRRFTRDALPAGVVLFARNVESTGQVAELLRELRGLWPLDGPPPLLAVDQEGGPVRRLKAPACPEVLDLPAARELAAAAAPGRTREVAEAAGRELAALGFNLDFAPVLDVDSNPANPVIGRRSFGRDPHVAAEQALAFADGLEAAGVLACGKHFPGHGDTDLDSHLALPRLAHDLERLRAVELVPFAIAARQRRVRAMMSAHIVFEALDPEWPATLSPRVIPELLRRELAFDGVLFSDDLEMRAIADHYDPATIARQGLLATLDVFLVCHHLELAAALREELAASAAGGGLLAERVAAAERRIVTLRSAARDHAARPWSGWPRG